MTPESMNFYTVLLEKLTPILLALIGLGTLWMNVRQSQMGVKLAELEKNTNSIKDALVKETKESSYAKGILEQKRREAEALTTIAAAPSATGAIVEAAQAVKGAAEAVVSSDKKEEKR